MFHDEERNVQVHEQMKNVDDFKSFISIFIFIYNDTGKIKLEPCIYFKI